MRFLPVLTIAVSMLVSLAAFEDVQARERSKRDSYEKERRQALILKRRQAHRNWLNTRKWGSTVAIGLPHPVDAGVSWTKPRGDSHSLTAGYVSFPLPSGKFKSLTADMQHLEYRYRSLPWIDQPVFWGIGLGVQKLNFSGTRPVNLTHEASGTNLEVDVDASMDVLSFYYTPHVGLVWYKRNGFHSGLSFGYLIPATANASLDARFSDDRFLDQSIKSTAAYQNLASDVEGLGRRAGKIGLPFLNLIELGYLF